MNRILSFSLTFILSVVLVSSGLAASKKNRSVYLDPLFGGNENGPTLAKKNVGKVITLDIAKKLKMLLEAKGIVVYLSRDRDSSVPLEERVSRSKIKGSDVYVTISLSRANNNCIQIYHPYQEQSVSENKKKNVGEILDQLIKRTNTEESIRLTEAIVDSLKIHSVPICKKVHSKSDYILDNTSTPTVLIDFEVLDSDSTSLYILDSSQVDKTLDAISGAIEKYLTTLSSSQ